MNAVAHCDSLAARALNLPESPIRALLSSHVTPGTLDLGGGHPAPELFPRELLRDAAERLLSDGLNGALQYASTEGLPELRHYIRDRLERRGLTLNPDQILITQGSQHALSTVALVLGAPERLALLEQPGYPGAHQAFALSQCRLGVLQVTADGWDLDPMATTNPTLVYVIPHFQNPTGRRATSAQMKQLTGEASRRDCFVIEDDAYAELAFDQVLSRPLVADCPDRGILLGSFSKTLCPGLRLGFIAAPKALVSPLSRALQSTTLQPGTLAQYLAWSVLKELDFDAHLECLRQQYRARAEALAARCRNLGLTHASPLGGFFLWAETVESASELAQRAAERGLCAVPEAAFRIPGMPGPDRHLRLAFCRYRDDDASSRQLAAALLPRNVL